MKPTERNARTPLVGIVLALLFCLMLGWIAPVASATDYDLTAKRASEKPPVQILTKTIDYTVDSATSSDTQKIFTIPAGSVVHQVYAYVDVGTTPATTFDLGDSSDEDGWAADVSTLTAGTDSNSGFTRKYRSAFQFYDASVSASQSAAVWGWEATTDVGGGATKGGIPMPFAGSVVGISVLSDTAVVTGTLTADATIDGKATGLQATISSKQTPSAVASQAVQLDTFTAGQRIGVKATSSSDWAHTSADVVVTVFVEFDEGAVAYSGGKFYPSADYIKVTPAGTMNQGTITYTMIYSKP